MDILTRRRFLLDLLCAGGLIAFTAGLGSQAEADPHRKLNKAINKAFKPTPTATPLPAPVNSTVLRHHPAGAVAPCPAPMPSPPGRVAPPPHK